MSLAYETLGTGPLGRELRVCVSPVHKFGTDAFLLADFAGARRKDLCADLGTGCGIIPMILYKKYFPKKIYAVELQPEAAAQCRETVSCSGAEETVFPIEGDLRRLGDAIPAGSLDLVTCNPPYKTAGTGLLNEDPGRQLARHELSCTIDDVCAAAARILKFGGRLCVCHRPERLAELFAALQSHGLEPKRLQLVQHGPDNPPSAALVEAVRQGRPGLAVLPTLLNT